MKNSIVHRYILAALLIITTHAVLVAGQERDAQFFDSVPVSLRTRLIERLNLFLELERAGDYAKKFELLSAYDRNHWKLDKTEYTKLMERMQASGELERNVAFKITHLDHLDLSQSPDQGSLMIYGQAKFRRGKNLGDGTRVLEASLENGEWYFSDWLTETTLYQRPTIRDRDGKN